ncbi:ABC transporter ATP-binding protein [Rhizobium sp. 1399]|uniref:ABC transporter ATP-binding protein n=1 Tax=Rhizobium sp. 1399 TaxID=2817758 RepID=UPI002858B04B|nr:ABC transporter ATP-binding protein [Rhizobium sp. 1399]MDR6670188.1 peptide/nickel transport system ATP-binding protein [Rhizobium sp. 1399]
MIHPSANETVLEVKNLSLQYRSSAGPIPILQDVSFALRRGEILGIIGESGAGKSTVGNALIGLLAPGVERAAGEIRFIGGPGDTGDRGRRRGDESRRISAVFQDHTASLDPLMSVGGQIEETILAANASLSRRQARARAIELLTRVGIPEPGRRYADYPHQFSGGQRQRIVIAIALSASPDVIVADEPTSALDATVQKQVLKLLRDLVDETGVSIVLITHDMGVVAEIADRVLVMRGGIVVEAGPTARILDAPSNDYTRALLAAVPRLRTSPTARPGQEGAMPAASLPSADGRDILSAQAISKIFEGRRMPWGLGADRGKTALRDVTIRIARGTITGIVGESGSGKTTIGRIIAGLDTASSGNVTLDGITFDASRNGWRTGLLGRVQMIFQDPAVSLNPRMTIGQALMESARFGARAGREDRRSAVTSMMDRLGLPRALLLRHPHQLSGGQKQRVCIARALLAKPSIIVADEPTSALDVTVQAEIIALLRQSVVQDQISMLFISHDLALVQDLCSDVYIFKDGRVEDAGSADDIFTRPANPYTRDLIGARPSRFVV